MPEERGEGYHQDVTEEHSFDELAKGLANRTISRREAFKWFGAAIAGTLLASIPGVALGQSSQGSGDVQAACAEFCRNYPFGGVIGRQDLVHRCIAQGARGTGPCFECSPGLTSGLVGPGYDTSCPEGQSFDVPHCRCVGTCTAAGASCGSDGSCCCLPTIEGGVQCAFCTSCAERGFTSLCNTDFDCGPGSFCTPQTTFPEAAGRCEALCPTGFCTDG
jgi:hypothetical protein